VLLEGLVQGGMGRGSKRAILLCAERPPSPNERRLGIRWMHISPGVLRFADGSGNLLCSQGMVVHRDAHVAL